MFENLTDTLTAVFDNLRRHGKLSEEDVEKACARCGWHCLRQM
jgi:signal recognition particle GTPase